VKRIAVKYIDLPAQTGSIHRDLIAAVEQVLKSGEFILGPEVGRFEERFAKLCGCAHALGVANGTDAIVMALKALGVGPGDEVITAANSFLASTAAITLVGAKPVFVDVRDDLNINPELIEGAITPRTKAILPVHLTGKPADMNPILEIASARKLDVVEDAAQAVGASYHGKQVGSFGAVGCFSLHPLKNLNAFGDGGMMTMQSESLRDKLAKMRNHGLRNRDESEFWAFNSRLDSLQAAFLNVKLNYLAAWTEERRKTAAFYRENLREFVECPVDAPHEQSVYHTFVIRADRRNELQRFLLDAGIETKIHYPIPIHLQPAARDLGYQRGDLPVTERLAETILSLPIYPELTTEQKEAVVEAIQNFYKS
jgi:dTDP-4-amino-4,6-dideoxygalactose transaminase